MSGSIRILVAQMRARAAGNRGQMRHYPELRRYLAKRQASHLTLAFAEVAGIIGGALPREAHS